MGAVKGILALLTLSIGMASLPIWFYLIYQIMKAVNATELMWFLFWIYVPLTIALHILGNTIRRLEE